MGVGPTEVAVERCVEFDRCRLGDRQARSEDRVGSEPRLVVGAVEFDHRGVEYPLIEGVEPVERVGDLAVDEPDRGADRLTAVPIATVAELDRLVFAGRRAGWNGRTTGCPRVERYLDLDGGVAAGVEDLAAEDGDDLTHTLANVPAAVSPRRRVAGAGLSLGRFDLIPQFVEGREVGRAQI